MGVYKHIRQVWKQPRKNLGELYRERIRPGFIVVRQRVMRGGHRRTHVGRKGRRSKHYGIKITLAKNYQSIAEQRAARKYPNCEVLNSYWVAKDPIYYWYEIILVDKAHPAIKSDKNISWITSPKHTRRVFRGLTSSAKKSKIKKK